MCNGMDRVEEFLGLIEISTKTLLLFRLLLKQMDPYMEFHVTVELLLSA